MPSGLRASVLAVVVAAVLVVVSAVAGGATAGAERSDRTAGRSDGQARAEAVTAQLEVGIAGIVSNVPRAPVRVLLTSERSRTVTLTLSNGSSELRRRVELNAGAATPVDFVMQLPVASLSAVVRDSDGAKVGHAEGGADIDGAVEVVGIGASIAGHRDPWTSDTIAGIQSATLVPVDAKLLARPGALDSLSGLVLGPNDLDRLDDDLQRRVAAWVARGGNLALDQARVDPLPVLGIAAEAGDRTAVEGGWVRFTGGRGAAGAWSEVVEPSNAYADSVGPASAAGMFGAQMGMGSNVFDETIRNLGLIHVDYLPSWVIVGAVLLSSILVGPILWMLLRTRRRRGWMWLLAPGISVLIAVALLAAGQGSLSDASTEAIGQVAATRWGTEGEFALGTTSAESELRLDDASEVWASSPRVVPDPSTTTVRQKVGANGFGAVGVGVIGVSDDALVSVTAVPSTGTKVKVSVHNASTATLTGVRLAGFGRNRGFSDVKPGRTEALEFETATEQNAFASIFPLDGSAQNGQFCGPNFCTGGTGVSSLGRLTALPRAQRGRVVVTGNLQAHLRIAGGKRLTSTLVSAVAAVAPASTAPSDPADAASLAPLVRIEGVGLPSSWVDAAPGMMGVKGGMTLDGFGNPTMSTVPPDVSVPPDVIASGSGSSIAVTQGAGVVPTTTVMVAGDVGATAPGPSFDGQSLPVLPERTNFALMTSPVEQPTLRCAVHTVVNSIDEWRNGAWQPIPEVGARGADTHFTDPNETRLLQFSPLAAGETRFLRVRSGLSVSPPAAISCRGDQ